MFLATISQLFHLPLRQTEGFVRSLFSLSFLPLPVPSFSTLCRRRRGLRVKVFEGARESEIGVRTMDFEQDDGDEGWGELYGVELERKGFRCLGKEESKKKERLS